MLYEVITDGELVAAFDPSNTMYGTLGYQLPLSGLMTP